MTEVNVPKAPFPYCGERLSTSVIDDFSLPFGLPDVHIPDHCDDAIEALSKLLGQLSFLNPIVKIAGCILSVVDVLKAIPDSLSPPSPQPIVDAISKLGDCITFLTDLTFATPSSVRSMISMVRGIIGSILKAMECILFMMEALIEASANADRLSQSPEESLKAMGQCLKEECETMERSIQDRLKKIEGLIVLVNLILGTVGPLVGINGRLPSTGDVKPDATGVAQLREVTSALSSVLSAIPAL